LVGSSNVDPGTEFSYAITGISPFDLSGVKLTGSVKLDGNGEALLKLPIAADGITEGTETLTLTLAGQTLSVPINDSSRAASADTVPPTLSAFAPADGAVGVAVNSNLAITFSEPISRGTGSIILKTAAGATVESFGPTSNRITVSGSTLTIDPTKSLDIYSRYVLDLGAGAVQDQAGNASVASNQYDFRTETTDGLYHFFVVAFGAAPGVTYMGQLAEATHAGLSLQDIVEIFTTKSQFTSVYPTTLTNKELATKLVENIVKASASEATKVSAAADIEAALGLGWSRGKVIYTVFGNLASKPLTDTVWGGTAKQFANQVAVARHFTETLEGDTTNVGRLQAVLGNVTKDSDVSSTAKLSQLLAQPSFVVSADKASVNEGSVAMFSISSYGLAAGSSVSYALSGTNLTGADVVGGSLAGSVTLDSSGSGFISVQFADDKTTEGNENLNLLLQGNVVKTITVLDTSTLPIATDTIVPTLIGSNYLSGSKDVPINANFFFTFSETIKKGNGTVQLLGANGALIEAFNVQTSSRLTWSGTQLTLDPSIDLANGQTYRLVIPPGAIDDQAGNGFAGVSVEITTVGDATPPTPPPGF
jgi:methionine-rich copper-binding protein CopC